MINAERILSMVYAGASALDVAHAIGESPWTVLQWVTEWREQQWW